MEKNQFRIGQLAHELDIERSVIRFWEKEFGISPSRTEGGQRYYTDKDLFFFKKIKKLLYEEGFTIAGAKKTMGENKKVVASKKTTLDDAPEAKEPLTERMLHLQKQLMKLRELL